MSTSRTTVTPGAVRETAGCLHAGTRLLVRRLRQLVNQTDLTAPESIALAHLDRHGSITSSALARLEQISPQAMGATVAALEDRGLVERHPDPEDRRNLLLSLSPAGQAAMEAGRDARTDAIAVALSAGFSAQEIATLAAAGPLLGRLAKVL